MATADDPAGSSSSGGGTTTSDATPSGVRLTLTVGGLPGTGTSTLCRLLEQHVGLPYVYAGQLFREQAARRGMTLAEFNALAQEDPEVDKALDARVLELLKSGGVIMEGRMSGWLAWKHELPAFKVWLTCTEQERVRRLVERDGADEAEQTAAMRDRVERETDRYQRYYGADLHDLDLYDLVLDSTHRPPDELARAVCIAAGIPEP